MSARDRVTWRHVLGYVLAGLSAWIVATAVIDMLHGI